MKKVTKNTIKKMIKENKEVTFYMIPCKVRLNSVWIQPMDFTVTSIEELNTKIANFEYYNCNSELGNYPHYYI